MIALLTLASEGVTEKTWWNPYLKGSIVALLAIGLFVGSAYLLLYTNVGSRLGFLLTAAAFFGFMTVLTMFWITGQFPNGPLGEELGWPVEEVVSDLSDSSIDDVRRLDEEADAAPEELSGQVEGDLETELTDGDGEFDLFSSPDRYLAVQAVATGGGRKWPFFWSEHPTYAAVQICPTADQEVLPLEAPPTPECDPDEPRAWAVSIKDLGSRRLPAWGFFGASFVLFLVSLLALHFYEKDQQAAEEPDDPGGSGGSGDGDGPGDGDTPDGNGQSTPSAPEPATT